MSFIYSTAIYKISSNIGVSVLKCKLTTQHIVPPHCRNSTREIPVVKVGDVLYLKA